MQALQLNAVNVFRYLLASECDLSLRDDYGDNVYLLATNNKTDYIDLLLKDDRLNPLDLCVENNNHEAALTKAVENNDLKLLVQMEKAHANLKNIFSDGNTLLHLACKAGSKQIIEYLT